MMNQENAANAIKSGETVLGIELGSTRIKSVLINASHEVIASGSYGWENSYVSGLWTYELSAAIEGLQKSYASLTEDARSKYGTDIENISAIGISGMMHGYLVLNEKGVQLSKFLTWRNTNTTEAASKLIETFDYNIPLRWSIAQLYQAILEGQEHVSNINYITTLAGYIHLKLSGEKVIGIGDASGMFPIDSEIKDFNQKMLAQFSVLVQGKYKWDIRKILPKVLVAGENAGYLTEDGARLLDPSGKLRAGIPMAPPEGDAETGMTATNSVAVNTGNVSTGTSIFSMVVLKKQLSKLYREIDMVTTPSGMPVAMVHCNNGTSEIDAWFGIFKRFAECSGIELKNNEIYDILYRESLEGSLDCDGIVTFNYLSGEPITGTTEGRPLVVRKADSDFSLANFMRSQIYSVLATLVIGMQILTDENVIIKRLTCHGGLFKTSGVAQRYMAAATNSSVTVMDNAGEGGPFGMALLAAYMKFRNPGESLDDYLQKKVFDISKGSTVVPNTQEVEGYARYLQKYRQALKTEMSAVENI